MLFRAPFWGPHVRDPSIFGKLSASFRLDAGAWPETTLLESSSMAFRDQKPQTLGAWTLPQGPSIRNRKYARKAIRTVPRTKVLDTLYLGISTH